MKRTALTRRTPLRAKPRRSSKTEREERKNWPVGAEPICVMAGLSKCDGPLECHHAIYRQTLRSHGLPQWPHEVRQTLCSQHHRRHHNGREKVPRSLLPGCLIEYAFVHGLLGWVERTYPLAVLSGEQA